MKSFIKPSGEYNNATEFLNKVGLPFVDGLEVEIVDDYNIDQKLMDADANYDFKLCFKTSFYLTYAFLVLLIVIGIYLD